MNPVPPARPSLLAGVSALAHAWLIVAALPPAMAATPDGPPAMPTAFFTERVRPLLERRCIECHGADAAEGGLRLDSLAGIAKGGRSGPAVRPTAAEQSLLVQAVRRLDESLSMPPEQPLDKEEIAVLVEWITGGAPHPDGQIPAVAAPNAEATIVTEVTG